MDEVYTGNFKKILPCAISQQVEKGTSNLGFLCVNHLIIYGHIWTCTLAALCQSGALWGSQSELDS